MKTYRNTSLIAASLVAASMGQMGAAFGGSSETTREIKIEPYSPSYIPIIPNKKSGDGNARFSPRYGGNQRQQRKDKRRSFAAGSLKAFAK